MTTTRPIPPERSTAEVCFAEKWPLERIRQMARVSAGDHATFDDSSEIHYSKGTGKISGVYLAYDNLITDDGGSRLDLPDDTGRWTPREMEVERRPIPSEPTVAEVCFAEKWPAARACEIASEVEVEDEDDGLVTCWFKDCSMVQYRKDYDVQSPFGFFAISLKYNIDADGELNIPGV
jgi:hypothetical protein